MPVPRIGWQTRPPCHLAPLRPQRCWEGRGPGVAKGFRSPLSPGCLVWVGLHLLWGDGCPVMRPVAWRGLVGMGPAFLRWVWASRPLYGASWSELFRLGFQTVILTLPYLPLWFSVISPLELRHDKGKVPGCHPAQCLSVFSFRFQMISCVLLLPSKEVSRRQTPFSFSISLLSFTPMPGQKRVQK